MLIADALHGSQKGVGGLAVVEHGKRHEIHRAVKLEGAEVR
jgi:hypothetical protein